MAWQPECLNTTTVIYLAHKSSPGARLSGEGSEGSSLRHVASTGAAGRACVKLEDLLQDASLTWLASWQ